MMLVGWATCLPWTLVVIPLMDTGKPVFYAVAIFGMQAIAAIGFGVMAVFIPELFATRYRYSGSALAVSQARRRSLQQAHRSKPKPLAVSRSQFGRIRRNPRRLNSSSSRNRSGRIRRRRLPTSPGSGYCFSSVATFDAAL